MSAHKIRDFRKKLRKILKLHSHWFSLKLKMISFLSSLISPSLSPRSPFLTKLLSRSPPKIKDWS